MPGLIRHGTGEDVSISFSFPDDGNDYSAMTLSWPVLDRERVQRWSVTATFSSARAGTLTVARATTSGKTPGPYTLHVLRTTSGSYRELDVIQYELYAVP